LPANHEYVTFFIAKSWNILRNETILNLNSCNENRLYIITKIFLQVGGGKVGRHQNSSPE